MNRAVSLFCLWAIGALAWTFPIPSTPFAPLNYKAVRVEVAPLIDGNPDEPVWQQAIWSTPFVDIAGTDKPAYETRFKIIWDDTNMYIAAQMDEPNLWATLTKHDDVIFHDNDFEVFIDPDGDTHDYHELELNALNTVWDLLVIKPYRDRDQVAVNGWELAGMQTAVHCFGSLNNSSDTDTGWTVEMALPWAALGECAHRPSPPRPGDYWRMNFSRVEWDLAKTNACYVKKTGANGQNLAEHNWVWSPQGLVAMHYPERWGFVSFVDSAVAVIPNPGLQPVELAKEALRKLYYAQKQYRDDHQHWAATLSELNFKCGEVPGYNCPPHMQVAGTLWQAELSGKNGVVRIRQDGLTECQEPPVTH